MKPVETVIVMNVNIEHLVIITEGFTAYIFMSIFVKILNQCIFYIDKRSKRSFNVKPELHDLEKIKLYKDHYYPTDDEISRLDDSQSLSKTKVQTFKSVKSKFNIFIK